MDKRPERTESYRAEAAFEESAKRLCQAEALRLSMLAITDDYALLGAIPIGDGSAEGDVEEATFSASLAKIIEGRLDPKTAATIALLLVKHYVSAGLLHWEEGLFAEFDGIGNREDGAALIRPEPKEQAP